MNFWYGKVGLLNLLLLPGSLVWIIASLISRLKPAYRAEPLVVCVGNLVVGGAGKTPLVLLLAQQLQKRGFKVGILSRGYGGAYKSPSVLVNPKINTPAQVGDEAYMMSHYAPVVVSRSKGVGVETLSYLDVDIVLMDDGMQNNTVKKDITILVLNTLNPFGNGLLLPAGPMREPLLWAKRRVAFAVATGPRNLKLEGRLQRNRLKFIRAELNPLQLQEEDFKKEYLAFSALGYPDKFYKALINCGLKVSLTKSFKDHHPYTERDLESLQKIAKQQGLQLITTEKDYVKLSGRYKDRVQVFKVELSLQERDLDFMLTYIVTKLKVKRKMHFNQLEN